MLTILLIVAVIMFVLVLMDVPKNMKWVIAVILLIEILQLASGTDWGTKYFH